ncbi:hypothetical protein C0Q70_02652 [Pomacea canaliculata]|uniref:SLC26A/SulP transporter domain-containing protein n=1 Tax=Pomacea canaliculata TaxID=400727 RepID=A0A2T7PQJ2_POMCA|nr:hypothetical protein C0Q70_02652 [Pomacea canaliculata]
MCVLFGLQVAATKFIPAIAALMSLQMWRCPDMEALTNANATEEITEAWQSRMREIQGGIMTASLAQVIIGCTGMLGLLLEYLGPITVVPTISLSGCRWWTWLSSSARNTGASRRCKMDCRSRVPLFSVPPQRQGTLPFMQQGKRLPTVKYPIFMLLPVILAVVLSWGFCAILTATNTLTEPGVRADSKVEVVKIARWFFFPYPGQWGMPTVSLASFMAMLAATITSIIESVGDYYACARISGVPPPPAHAVNRGIAIEGLGSLISGAVGSGGATTSYSQNVGAIGFTKVASRWAFVAAGIIFLVSGLCGKFGAFLTMLPDPVLGGIVLVSFGMVTSVGLSNLSFVDLSSGRNLCIIGSSLLVGLMVPRYLADHPDAIQTGNSDLDQVLKVLMGTAMFRGRRPGFLPRQHCSRLRTSQTPASPQTTTTSRPTSTAFRAWPPAYVVLRAADTSPSCPPSPSDGALPSRGCVGCYEVARQQITDDGFIARFLTYTNRKPYIPICISSMDVLYNVIRGHEE